MAPIETKRLIIRNFRPDDWKDLQKMVIQFQQSEYASYDHEWPTSDERVQEIARGFASGDSHMAVVLKDGGKLIGFVSLSRGKQELPVEFDVGYYFNSDYHREGYATEGCNSVLNHAFTNLNAQMITTGTAKENVPSCKLLERIGMSKTGEEICSFRKSADGKPIEFVGFSFAITRAQWPKMSRRDH